MNIGFSAFAHPGRFELPTLGFVVRCSIQLSYGCVGDAVDSTTEPDARGKRGGLRDGGAQGRLGREGCVELAIGPLGRRGWCRSEIGGSTYGSVP